MKHSKVQHTWKIVMAVWCLLVLPFLAAVSQEMPVTTNSPEALQLYWQGVAKAENVDMQKALPFFEQAVQKDPNFALALIQKAGTETDPAKAEADRQKALSLKEKVTEGERMLIEALTAFTQRNTGEALGTLDKLATMFPADKHVQLTAAMLYQNTSQPQKALEHSTRAVTIDKEFAPAYNIIGYANIDLGNNTDPEGRPAAGPSPSTAPALCPTADHGDPALPAGDPGAGAAATGCHSAWFRVLP